MKSVADTSNDAAHRMEKIISTFLQGHAQMADEQEKALEVTTNKVQSRMKALADLVGETYEGTMELKATLQHLIPVVLDLSARQAAMEDVRPPAKLLHVIDIFRRNPQQCSLPWSMLLSSCRRIRRSWHRHRPLSLGSTRIWTELLRLSNHGLRAFQSVVGGQIGAYASVLRWQH
jgi:hypothetical protein